MINNSEVKIHNSYHFGGLNGSGKDSVAEEVIFQHLPLTSKIISTGKIVREAMASENNQYHKILKGNFEKSKNGGLVDDMPILRVVINEIDTGMKAGKDTDIFPGFERTQFQYDYMNKHYETYMENGVEVRPVYIFLAISEKTAIERAQLRSDMDIANGQTPRIDDQPPVVKKRIDAFNREIWPFWNYLIQQNKVVTVKGDQDIRDVARQVLGVLKIVPNEEIIQRAYNKIMKKDK